VFLRADGQTQRQAGTQAWRCFYLLVTIFLRTLLKN